MKIALISTGSELLTGKANTNAAFIGDRLFSLGLELSCVTDIADRKEELSRELKKAFEINSVVILTGGLGPTFDDITVETMAETFGLKIYQDKKVLEAIAERFAKLNITSPTKNNDRQANIIKGAKVLENRNGTAPGQMLHFEYLDGQKRLRKTLFLFPGPPKELQPMFEENAVPFFRSYASGIRKNFVISVFGLGESAVEEMIRPVINAVSFGEEKFVEFGILAHKSIVDVKFSVSGTDEMLVDETVSNIKSGFEEVLKDNIFSQDGETLASVCGKLLLHNKKTVAFAESCTGGLIAKKITDVSGSSEYFKSSCVTYSNESKIKMLGVKEETLNSFGAVSAETAVEMAAGVLKFSESDYAVSITGIAGPTGATKEKPVGLVYIGMASKKGTKVFKYNFFGTREDIRERSSNAALDLLRRELSQKEEPVKNKKAVGKK
ncbi:competence/damage-inducible protein A [Endomicrobium proavitum]|uniref:CinA-like protein n=1 Tax=Endomicrobium proavitum TaxID=1408281 RepID=A0A0G3WK91_9BACT|nr:competence/damage-inducible protein A [Endomicrobium proavitum]AKL98297.1 CinA-like protein [Endomicrobium proavitum]